MSTMSAAGSTRFYVGTFTKGTASEGIYAGDLDPATGAIRNLRIVAVADNPSYLAVSPDGGTLYSVVESAGGEVGAFGVGPDGGLVPLNSRPSGGGGPCYLAVTPSGSHLLVANYGGGSAASIAIRDDGSIGELAALKPFEGSGPHPTRQKKSYAHAAVPCPEGRFIYVCDLGADKVWSFRLDPATGALAPTEPAAGETPPGSGPRHIVLSPDGQFAYVNNELGLSVTAFRRDPATGALAAFQTLPTTPGIEGPVEGVTTAAIALHPNGKFIYVSSRGDNTLSAFTIAADGSVDFLENIPAGVDTPRGMALDPSGRWLLVAGQKDNRIVTFAIDPDSGRATPTGHDARVPAPVCVTFPSAGTDR